MNPTAFIELLNQKNPSDFKDFKQLDRLLKNHPYFQIGLAAKSKYLKANQHIDFIKTSRKTAVIFPDRSKLHQYLTIDKEAINPAVNLPEETSRENEQKTEVKTTIKRLEEPPEITAEPLTDEESLSELEKNYLAEAINQSIQLEAAEVVVVEDAEKTPIKSDEQEKEVLSFSDWLSGKSKTTPRQLEGKLIDDFISEDPVITSVQKKEFYSPIEKGKESISDDNLPVSETLARILADQGNKVMAIKSYEKLMLKYPEKSIYFAGLIKKLKEK